MNSHDRLELGNCVSRLEIVSDFNLLVVVILICGVGWCAQEGITSPCCKLEILPLVARVQSNLVNRRGEQNPPSTEFSFLVDMSEL